MLEVTTENFESDVLGSETPVAVDFWASWCGPCKMMAPIFESVSEEHTDVKFAKCNADENEALLAKYGIMGIPTILLFKNGEVVGKSVGLKKQEVLSQFIADNK